MPLGYPLIPPEVGSGYNLKANRSCQHKLEESDDPARTRSGKGKGKVKQNPNAQIGAQAIARVLLTGVYFLPDGVVAMQRLGLTTLEDSDAGRLGQHGISAALAGATAIHVQRVDGA
ncbi:unnamed protein product [Alternaria alternata]